MYRQSASRNQRLTGFKVKHVQQICVLVAVCFWLIYQVKHFHEKKKEFDHNDAKISQNMHRDNEILKFGRKDLNPQVKEKTKENEKNEEEVEDEIGEEEKHEEEQKEDHKTEKKEVEGGGGVDDEADEHDQEKPDSDVDREEEFIDEEKEREEDDEEESEEKDVEDSDSQTETEKATEDHDDDGEIRNTNEAREEQYKADDASSAVTHDGQNINAENENSSVENHVNIVEHENKGNNTEESNININQYTTAFKVQEVETAENGTSTSTVNEENSSKVFDSTSQGSSSLNSTITSESNDKPKSINEQTGGANTEFHGLSLKNGTAVIMLEPGHAQNVTRGTTSAEGSNFQTDVLEQTDNSGLALDNSQLDSNSTTSNTTKNVEGKTVESSNSSMSSHFAASENSMQSNVSAETKDGSESTITEVNMDAIQNEKSDISGGTDGTYESSDSNNTENTDEVQHDTIDSADSSVPLDDKGVHVDLDTLPDIRTEGSYSEETAEE